MRKNRISIKRVPGVASRVTATLVIEFDPMDNFAVERFGRVMRELIPEEERAKFLEDFSAAGAAAGFTVADPTR